MHPLLTSFSVLSNGRKLLHISRHSTSKEQIETFHGLRVISMMWIVAGHGFISWEKVPVVNKEEWGDSVRRTYCSFVSKSCQYSTISVDKASVRRIHHHSSLGCGYVFLHVGVSDSFPIPKV